jgi:hypothetical protein
VQFRATDTTKGWLRRFAQMVFEVTYADPRQAPPSLLGDTIAPLIRNIAIAPANVVQSIGTAATQAVNVSATVTDTGGSAGVLDVTVLYTADGTRWKIAPLAKVGGVYQGTIHTQLNGASVVALIQARDSAGNVAAQALKGSLSSAFTVVSVPIIRR